MSDLLTPDVPHGAHRRRASLAGMPLLFAALGETIAEQSGLLNVGPRGDDAHRRLRAASSVALATGNVWLGLGGRRGRRAWSCRLVMVLFCVRMGLDQIVVGIAILLSRGGRSRACCTARCSASLPAPRRRAEQFRDPASSARSRSWAASLFSQPLPCTRPRPDLRRDRRVALPAHHRGPRPARGRARSPDALDAAGVTSSACGRSRSWRAARSPGMGGAYMAIVGAGHLRAVHDRRPRLHRDRHRDARPRAARGAPSSARCCSASSLSIATALQLVGIDDPRGRGPDAAVHLRHGRARRCSRASRSCRPRSASPTSAGAADPCA